ncbi:hypothetical protein D5H75_31375 [Bailinhaonella thermotolerans]|uniref:Uncharacterized protein n=1 Tax=Bailinhaonella thermotolerans TaxID=1070861 RepID=A0A3A4AD07_9ACTN|nr:hypothetical protein D5H75_31375 [Bailinhaonella thermotolerans]
MEEMVRAGRATVRETRYAGVYEGGEWACFPCPAGEVPGEAFGSDVVASAWWAENGSRVGVGDTPEAAMGDLASRLTGGS